MSTTAATATIRSKQQQKLLEDDPGAVLPLADQEELHGRPVDPPVTQHVDQVDQHGRRGGRQSPEQDGMNKCVHGESENDLLWANCRTVLLSLRIPPDTAGGRGVLIPKSLNP